MIKNKKAQGLSMSTIIIALLALLVLVVVGMIFSGSLGDWAAKIRGIFTGKVCEGSDGLNGRISLPNECEDDETQYMGFVNKLPEGKVCCVPK